MAVQLFYVDESFDDERFCLTGLWIRHRDWHQCFDATRAHRLELRDTFGLRVRKELHARELVSGRGALGTQAPLTKWQRSRIYFGVLRLLARLPVRLINVCLDVKKHGSEAHILAWDRLVNRIERSMKAIDDEETILRHRLMASTLPSMKKEDGELLKGRLEAFACRALIISDAGHEKDITRALRRMHVYNPIPSKFGEWSPGQRVKSITTDHIIEDPVFRDSASSPLLQLADCASFALLKRETTPTKLVKKYNLRRRARPAVLHEGFVERSLRHRPWLSQPKEKATSVARAESIAWPGDQIDSAPRACALIPSSSSAVLRSMCRDRRLNQR